MYISLLLFTDLVVLPKNQVRLISEVFTNSDPHTNIGFISYEKTTSSQAQRIRADIRALVKLGYVRKFPMTRATDSMKKLSTQRSGKIKFYMLNPIHQHQDNADLEGLKNIWQLLR